MQERRQILELRSKELRFWPFIPGKTRSTQMRTGLGPKDAIRRPPSLPEREPQHFVACTVTRGLGEAEAAGPGEV